MALKKFKQPRKWKELERHPLSAEYADLKGWLWQDYLDGVKEHGILDRKIVLFEGKVMEGWQLQRACVELNKRPTYRGLPRGVDPEEFVKLMNDNRRHEDEEARKAHRQKRIERIAAARANGQSIRAIAEEAGVSKTQVEEDLKEAAVQGVDTCPEKIVGMDEKEYPASKPAPVLCDRCTRVGAVKGCSMCKEARQAGKPKPPKADPARPSGMQDAFGNEVPAKCKDAYKDPWIQETIDFLAVLVNQFWQKRLADGLNKRKKHYPFFVPKDFIDGCGMVGNTMEQILDHLKENRPAGVCPSCDGVGCSDCKLSGLVPRKLYGELKKKAKEAVK